MPTNGPAAAESSVRRFLAAARHPVLLEPGEEQFPLADSTYSIEWRGSRLLLQVWDDTRNLARRITGLREERPGRLELAVERFGGRPGRVFLLDLGRVSPAEERKGERLVWREEFRRSLHRQFPDWRLAELSAEANLEESLSPAYPRALIRKGAAGWAALWSPPEQGAASGALTFGLIWLDYLRRRESRLTIEGLALFLPQAEARAACLRLPFLNPRAARFQVFVYTPEGYEDTLDPADYGNLETKLDTAAATMQLDPAYASIAALPFVESVACGGGGISLRVRGLEFARVSGKGLSFGLDRKTAGRPGSLPEIEALAREIARQRSPGTADRANPIWSRQPEAWLESQVRRRLAAVDASLLEAPIYGQVPAVAGGDRRVIDLVAAGRDGRLAVLELKASEDIHLPLQALDYWMRVRWHAERGEFSRKGYFPGVELLTRWPRLLLVAPALSFHPKTETILRYFDPSIEVERIGLGVEWRQGLRVMFRVKGARRPI
ncbi:MAG: hypothetical protein ACM336_20240 [Acidobacteriota bacterium]